MKSNSQIKPIQLVNKLGLTGRAIVEAETLFMTLAAVEGMPKGRYDLAHLMRTHQHAFGEMYSWAGNLSAQVTIGAVAKLTECLDSLAAQDVGDMTSTSFADSLAKHYAVLQANDPFDHGSGRAIRFLIEGYATDQGMSIDWGMHSSQSMSQALEYASHGDTSHLQQLLKAMVSHQDLYQAQSADGIAYRTAEIFQAAGLSESVVMMQSIIGQSDISTLGANLSDAFKDALVTSSNHLHPLQSQWDRTSIVAKELPSAVDDPVLNSQHTSNPERSIIKMRN